MALVTQAIFNSRLKTCSSCPWWKHKRCLRGHSIYSLLGCPIRKFPPIGHNGFAKDRTPPPQDGVRAQEPPAPVPSAGKPGCGSGCRGAATKPAQKLQKLSAVTVAKHFVEAMIRWKRGNFKLVDPAVHEQRQQVCANCPEFVNFQCRQCGCVVKLKTKLATESCPLGYWASQQST